MAFKWSIAAALGCVFAQGANLQRQCLLIVCGNAGVQSDPKGVAKNLPGSRLRKLAFCGHFRRVAEHGRNLMIVARQDSDYAAADVASRASVSR